LFVCLLQASGSVVVRLLSKDRDAQNSLNVFAVFPKQGSRESRRVGQGRERRMSTRKPKQSRVLLVATLLVIDPLHFLYGQEAGNTPGTGNPTEPAAQSAEQLQALVAPIALYPDSLVAQILTAATFPDQVAIANYWVEQNKNLTGSALMQAVDKQSWDASVKALTQFPSVLGNLASNLAWTSSLGEAYHNQQSEVMTAIQTLRAQAKEKGTLKSSSQITVVQQSPQTIVIQPANPQIVYVPQYNPTVVYGTPYVVPNYVAPAYTAGDVAAAGIIGFGAGIAVGAMMSGGCCSWGYSSWNCGWHGTAVVYHGGAYYGNAAWHGGYYGGYGYHASGPYGGASTYHGAYGSAASYHGYAANGTYHTGTAYNTAWGSGASHTNYAPNGASHTSGGGYNATTGQSFHYGSSTDAMGGSTYHGTTSTGQHYAGGTTAAGKSWGGSNSDGWASRADSNRGWGSMRSSGFGGGRFGGGGFGGGGFRR
jgi:hypothetical protein